MSEWVNYRLNEWITEWRMNYWTNGLQNEQMNCRMNEWITEWMNELCRMNEWTTERMNECTTAWMNNRVKYSMNELQKEWMEK